MSKIKKKNSIWYFDDYFEFLYKKEKEIPESIKHFVLDSKRYLFNTQMNFRQFSFLLKG